MASPNRNAHHNEDTSAPRSGFVERTQPMEASRETTVENWPVGDPLYAKFIWRIEDFSSLIVEKLYSGVYELGYSKWRFLLFPLGNHVNYLSLYLDVADSATLPYGWRIYAKFRLAVVNQFNSMFTIRKETVHQFNAEEKDRGFGLFMPLEVFYNPRQGYLVNDACIIEAEVLAYGVTDHWLYDSKKEVGFVGIKNQGATCYLNSLIQTLYHIPYFRKVVYYMPTNYNDEPSRSFPLALQRLFFELQYGDSSVATNGLTRSFGWDPSDAFMQHDVQEMNRLLCAALEESMEGTVVDGAIQELFEGHHKSYIECINVEYNSSRMESFYDLQLDVKGCQDVYASFDKFIAIEHLDGDNKYHAEHYGLQDARKGVLFVDFPPVLQLHLKRFEYDFVRDTMVKINDRYEFPLRLDLNRGDGKYLSPEADRSVRNLYALHSVLVHSGGVHGGHYYAFIRPDLSTQWYKFDDEKVTREDMDKAVEGLYGGESNLEVTYMMNSNAYMLVYIRESDKEKILCDADEKDITVHLRERLWRELHKKKEKAKADAYTVVKVATDEDFKQQVGGYIYFDLVDFEIVRSLRVWKLMLFNIFKEVVEKESGVPVHFQRFWIWGERENGSCRPLRPLTLLEEAQTVGHLTELYGMHGQLKLFLELERGQDSCPMPLPYIAEDDILLFFKVYDPEKEELRYAGRLFVKCYSLPMDILAKLNELACFDPDENIELFEEIRHEPYVMCEPIDSGFSFMSSQLWNGDILCLQKSLSPQIRQRLCFPNVPMFLKYRRNIQEIAQEFGVPVQFQHHWPWARHQNVICHPYRPLTLLEEIQTL